MLAGDPERAPQDYRAHEHGADSRAGRARLPDRSRSAWRCREALVARQGEADSNAGLCMGKGNRRAGLLGPSALCRRGLLDGDGKVKGSTVAIAPNLTRKKRATTTLKPVMNSLIREWPSACPKRMGGTLAGNLRFQLLALFLLSQMRRGPDLKAAASAEEQGGKDRTARYTNGIVWTAQ